MSYTAPTTPVGAAPGAQDFQAQAAQLYQNAFGRAGDPEGIAYWAGQLASGVSPRTVAVNFDQSADMTMQNYTADPAAFDQANPGVSNYFVPPPQDTSFAMEQNPGGPTLPPAEGTAPRQVRTYTVNGQPAPLDANGNPIGNTDDNFGGGNAGDTGPAMAAQSSGNPFNDQAAQMYQSAFGRAGDPEGIAYWGQQLAGGMKPEQVRAEFNKSASAVHQAYNANPAGYTAANPASASLIKNDPGVAPMPAPRTQGNTLFSMGTTPSLPNGAPDYMALANQQAQSNLQNAKLQNDMNNPNVYGPGGSQVRTQNADGTYSVTQTLSPAMQQAYDAQNGLQTKLIGNASQIAGGPALTYGDSPAAPTFNPSGAPALKQFDTSGVSAIPTADANNLNATRDAVYSQQTQYLDPQYQQAQSDLDSKLANQGIMPGSEAYNREINNFALNKQKAYGDARNSSIVAGGAEQSRLFDLGLKSNQAGQSNALNDFNTGLQAHTTGTNDALANFNTGLQSRQQGVSEANTLHNSPINDLASLRTGSPVATPTYGGQVGTSIPGVDYINAGTQGFNANMGIQNADAAQRSNMYGGLFGLGAAALQNPGAVTGLYNWITS